MTSSPKRHWFRFGLLSAVLMMVAAGGMLWLSIRERAAPSGMSGTWRGFPFPMYSNMRLWVGGLANDKNALVWSHDSFVKVGPIRFHYQDNGWCYGLVVVNALIGIAVLSFVGVVSEFLIRRREARKQ